MKNQYIRGITYKRMLRQFAYLRRGEGVDTPMHTMDFGYYRNFVWFYSLKWNSLDCIIVLYEGNECHFSLSYFINIMLCLISINCKQCNNKMLMLLTLFRMGQWRVAKRPPNSLSPVTSTNIGIRSGAPLKKLFFLIKSL